MRSGLQSLLLLGAGCALLAGGLYALASRPPDPAPKDHPTIDQRSRDALARELERGEATE